ncbi:MAG: hypothetical protein AVDCRST_MAG83-2593 [uncultured Arthrobacter sp.]|uniref:Uncharacterized protein n=1 Tax=uncultured Arthrobacter sp. TaxID=114050 RepID=A0A6J4IGX6_9MICC|nr:hypothetical protein [uncultured Arthrobacter sp.]CAA9250518.1 MAG: hypothetical protein AVDCRST_MAG83-2593 [uncultured Arthrobacter sp.]
MTAQGIVRLPTGDAADLGGRLLRQARELEEIRHRAAAVAALDWESPAGRNFRQYLAGRASAVGSAAELLEQAARLAEVYAAELGDAAGSLAGSIGP